MQDEFPDHPGETTDTDKDGWGDAKADWAPTDPAEHSDADNDAVGDSTDAFPDDANETADEDADGSFIKLLLLCPPFHSPPPLPSPPHCLSRC